MKTKLLFTTCFLMMSFLKAQIITTVAGNGIPGYSGDGGQATAAELHWPWYGTFDTQGNMYVVEYFNNVIRKINPSGIITTVAGTGISGYSGDGGQATAAKLHSPEAITFDATGNFYISDSNNVIRKVTPAGIISTIVGIGMAGYSGDGGSATAAKLNTPYGMTFDNQGNLYIADGSNNRIRMVNPSGIITTVAGNGYGGYGGDGGQATATELNLPIAVTVDASGNIYIADQYNQRIRMVNNSGIIQSIAGSGPTGYNYGGYSGDGGQATDAVLDLPSDMRFDTQGNLYIADLWNNRIRKINPAGIITTVAGIGGIQGNTGGYNGDGEPATAAKLNIPSSVFFDAGGNLYMTDQGNHRVRKINLSTSISPVADFQASSRQVCAGATITFSDSTTNAMVTGWQWSFPGGTLANGYTLTDATPKVIYNTPGMYAVTYTASNAAGQGTVTKTAYINVLTTQGTYNTNFTEGFETSVVPGTDWSVSSSGGSNWMLTSSAAATGSKSIMINNMDNTVNDTSALTGPTFNLAAVGSPVLAFSMAYQQKTTANTDKLQVFVSTDCGSTWISKWARTGTALQPASVSGQSTTSFTPSPNQFTTYTVNISSVASNSNTMFRWVFYAGASSVGNNIYLDNINITGTAAGIQNINENLDLAIYPNPANENFTIETNANEKQVLQIFDMKGSLVLTKMINGNTTIDASNLQAGIYNVSITGMANKKLVIVK